MVCETELKKMSCNLIACPDDYMYAFRENVRMYIDHKKITLAEVAELADMPESTLKTFIYNGGQDCRLSTAVKLARVFNVSIDELVGAGTMSQETCITLQKIRQLPQSFTHFVMYTTKRHYQRLTDGEISDKAIEVSFPDIDGHGSMVMTNHYEILDISNLSEEIRAKTFMGLTIPSDLYEPEFFKGDTLLLANDRNPKDGELIVASVGENIYILRCKFENVDGKLVRAYYSVRDGKKRSSEHRVKLLLGYVVKIIPGGSDVLNFEK